MGFLDNIVKGLTWLICGPPAPPPPPSPSEDIYLPPSVPHRPQHRPPPSSPPSYQHHHQQQTHQEQPQNGHVVVSQPPPQHRPSPPHGQRVVRCGLGLSLRSRANELGDRVRELSRESQAAFKRGDKALAKELSNQSKALRSEMEQVNQQACEWIFVENNKDSAPDEVDLHGLTVKEALEFTERSIQQGQQRGQKEMHLIVGKGLHSANGQAKIRPAVESLMTKYQLVAELDPRNSGVLIVSLDGKDKGTGQIVHPDDIARGIENRDDRCIIM